MTKAKSIRVAVIGAGASGIATAVKLRDAGIEDIVIFEKTTELGGTWRDNRYPGLTCDVPSHLYRFSFAPNPEWSHRYSPGAEIQRYMKSVADDFDVRKLIRFSSEVTGAAYADGQWRIETTNGDQGLFDVVITAVGVLHHPAYPDIEGLRDFKGPAFHTARWDESVDLKGKRVGIIGNGSTATQILPAIVEDAAKVSLFMRTPQWIMPQANPPIPEERKAQYRADPVAMAERFRYLAGVFNGTFCAAVAGDNPEAYADMATACADNLNDSVTDPVLKTRLTPDYKVGCKRLIVSDLFYPAIQRTNAELVTDAIQRIEPGGIRTVDRRLHELDVLVLATGFNPHQFFKPMNVTGEGGRSLDEVWSKANIAYRGISVPGFPNWFMLGGPNSPIGNFSFLMTVEHQLNYVLQLVALIQTGQARAVAAKMEPTRAYNAALKAKMDGSIWASGCRSWYIDKNGNVASYPWSYETFERDMSAPVLEDFELA
jgi:cation diffusion facilitator CzcD-associated flavoprotein CzcO